MKHVVFVTPFFGSNVLRCLKALVELPNVRVGLITHEPDKYIPPFLKETLAGHFQIRNCSDPDQLILATRAFAKEWGHVDRLIGYLEQLQLPLAQAREALGLPGMHAESARCFRDKNRMKQVLGDAGLPVAAQALLRGAEDAHRFIERVGYPVVLKPVAGVGTKDTMRASNDGELGYALNRLLPSRDNPVQAERFVTGAEHTLEAVSIKGEVVWHSSTYYLPGPLQVVENPWMQYCVLLPRDRFLPHVESFRPLNAKALSALGMETGLSHMEWFLPQDGQPVISEVAARPPGVNIMGMMGLAHEVDMWSKWAHLMVHEEFEVPERRWACGTAFLRGHGPGRAVAAVEGLEVVNELGDAVVESRLPQVGQPRSSHYEGEGFVTLRMEETAQVVQALRTLITKVQLRYA